MHEVWVFRGQRGPPPVYVPKLCTGPHIGTITNVVLINSSSIINLQYIISCSLTLCQVITIHNNSTSNSYKTFEYHHRKPTSSVILTLRYHFSLSLVSKLIHCFEVVSSLCFTGSCVLKYRPSSQPSVSGLDLFRRHFLFRIINLVRLCTSL